MRISDMPDIEKLDISEKILLVEDIWESIASDDSAVPVPRSHQEELDRRLAAYESAPGETLSLDELRSRLLRKK